MLTHTGIDGSTSPEEAAARLAELEAWLERNRVWWDRNAIAFRPHLRGQGLGLGVIALQPLKEGQLLCVIPKEVVLSVKTTAIADLLAGAELYGSVGLAIALMYEMSQGTKSKWYGYLQCIPAFEPLPMYWDPAELAPLQGTELTYILDNDKERLQEDYDMQVGPFADEHRERTGGREVLSFELFKRASSLIASRAFGVDAYHGDAMLPVADIFNHTGREHVHIQSDGDVCTVCGSPDPCPHTRHQEGEEDEHEEEEEEEEKEEKAEEKEKEKEEKEEEEEEQKHEEHGSHDEEDEMVEEVEEDEEEEDEEWPRPDGVVESKHALDIVMIREAAAGEEVYNTYGPLPNVVLLNKHGFVEIPNLNDCVSVDEALIREVSAKCLGNAEAANKRLAFCQSRKKIFGEDLCYNFHYNGTAERELLWVLFVLFAPPATCVKMAKAKPALLYKQLRSIDKRQLAADECVRGMLVALARARLGLYPPTTLEEDRRALAKAQSDGSKAILVWALMLRVAEKELLGRVIKRYGAKSDASVSAGAGEPGKRKRQPAAAGGKKKANNKAKAVATKKKAK